MLASAGVALAAHRPFGFTPVPQHIGVQLWSVREDMKKDPDIQQMKAQLQAYMQDNYKEEIKRLNAKLKAARVQAHARGIKWTPPAQE